MDFERKFGVHPHGIPSGDNSDFVYPCSSRQGVRIITRMAETQSHRRMESRGALTPTDGSPTEAWFHNSPTVYECTCGLQCDLSTLRASDGRYAIDIPRRLVSE